APLSYFLDESNPYDLGEVQGLRVYPAADLMGNVIKSGYPKKEIDNVNGKYSFNNTTTRTTQRKVVVRDITLISPYQADPFYIEITRINLAGKTTTDNEADSELFILNTSSLRNIGVRAAFFSTPPISIFLPARHILQLPAFMADYVPKGATIAIVGSNNAGSYLVIDDPVVDIQAGTVNAFFGAAWLVPGTHPITLSSNVNILKRATYSAISGIPEPAKIFNIESLTPMRIVLNHFRYINSLLYDLVGTKVKFETADRNSALSTTLNGVTIAENGDYTITADRHFLPWWFEFSVPALPEILEQIGNTRALAFTHNGTRFTGFVWKGGVYANDYQPYTFKLLAAPSTDLKILIDA
ncbi:MAG: hypothetical protein ACRC3B_11395, partial [Bacteroidia bacterium]